MLSQAQGASRPNDMRAELLRARTLEEMLQVVPLLGECDSLGAADALAAYDRQAVGWLTSVLSWLGVVLGVASAMLLVGGLLFKVGQVLGESLRESADGLIDGSGGVPLHLLLGLAGLALWGLAFYHAGPRRWLVAATRRLLSRLSLRVELLRAVRSQVERNRRIVAGDWRGAVCRDCLSRYELHRVRLAYGRRPGFGRCRECHNDAACYARVRRIEGWLDERMAESQLRAGDAVRVNLLDRLQPPRGTRRARAPSPSPGRVSRPHRLAANSLPLPADMDELVIGDAGDEEVETFIFLYRGVQPRTRLPRPDRLSFRLTEDSGVSPMSWRQLKQNFRFVSAPVRRN